MVQSVADATQEQLTKFKDAFPSFQLENELFHNEGSVIDPFIGRTYHSTNTDLG
jgi:hypothetical protein